MPAQRGDDDDNAGKQDRDPQHKQAPQDQVPAHGHQHLPEALKIRVPLNFLVRDGDAMIPPDILITDGKDVLMQALRPTRWHVERIEHRDWLVVEEWVRMP